MLFSPAEGHSTATTSGANKPLKDLAWGLASRGVAVLRFDKVIHANPAAADAPGFTMSDEYVPHAVAAIRILQGGSTVDPAQVFVLGHSMEDEEKVAPRVAAVEPSVAGLVILAGDTQPMHRAAIRVARYLASLDPSVATSDAIEAITRQAELVDEPDLSASTPAPATCRSACRARGRTCGATTRSRLRPRSTCPCWSSRAAGTTRSQSPMISRGGRQVSLTEPMSRSVFIRPTTTSSSQEKGTRRRRSNLPNTSTLRLS